MKTGIFLMLWLSIISLSISLGLTAYFIDYRLDKLEQRVLIN